MTQTRDPRTGALFDDGAEHITQATLISGERNQDSATNSYLVIREECNITICDGLNAVPIGGGAQNDTHLMGILIAADATAVTATIVGFTKVDNTGAELAGTIVVTGNDSDAGGGEGDRFIDFKGAINDNAALTVQASADEKVTVFWRPIA